MTLEGTLNQVAQHRCRPGRASSPHCSQLHGRQVLRFIENDVAQARGALKVIVDLIEQDGVGH